MFNIARLPRPQCDVFSTLPPNGEPFARSILVSIRDWLYVVEVIDAKHGLITPPALEARLRGVIADVDNRLARSETAPLISVLSADHRDRWTKVSFQVKYNYLP